MFRVSQHLSSGLLKTVPAASARGHTTCTATPLQRGLQAEACNTDTTPTQPHRNSNTHRTKNNTTNVVIQQNSHKLLMMDILMSETHWSHKKWNKIASDIMLVFYFSTITMMHGPIYIRWKTHWMFIYLFHVFIYLLTCSFYVRLLLVTPIIKAIYSKTKCTQLATWLGAE